ncbi:hypothetical protein SCHIN_v1c08600 [Spiroplasma chinense]|uniref:Uncharacterized protein n=1 Tax=Spiroplasma chinense TaxID=216932 RepID=A0A5B9Y5F7_9MOLU|nr:hypothetical protein [Spiroplasma chinense]QEH62055.1 hypothetical protein SCHIN_v1c08600 [Spiroplasma chinense]
MNSKSKKLYENKFIWNIVGSEFLQSYALSKKINLSFEEIYDCFVDDEFLDDEIYNIFEPEVVNIARAWIELKNKTFKLKEAEAKTGEICNFPLNELKEVYGILVPNNENTELFDLKSEKSKDFVSTLVYIKKNLYGRKTVESVVEFLLQYRLWFLTQNWVGENANVFSMLLIQSVLIYIGFSPLNLSIQENGEEIFCVDRNSLNQLKEEPIEDWNNNKFFKEHLGVYIEKTNGFFDIDQFIV